jgi:hypothetical protein
MHRQLFIIIQTTFSFLAKSNFIFLNLQTTLSTTQPGFLAGKKKAFGF